jgi:hypothetical protein
MKPRELAHAKIGRIEPPAFEHINRQIPPEPHTAMYVRQQTSAALAEDPPP